MLCSILQNGPSFETVAEVCSLSPLPRVMRATRSWRGSGPDSSLDENELLLVEKVCRPKLKGWRTLKVFSLKYKKKKTLTESCVGRFSASPYDCRLFLPEILEFMEDSLPLQATIFVNSESKLDFSHNLASTVITIQNFRTETTVVCTTEPSADLRSDKLVDIPIDLDICVQVYTMYMYI